MPAAQIDKRFYDSPYYIAPNDDVGQEAFAVIREAMKGKNMVGLGRIVLNKRERVIALEPFGKGLIGTTLHYPYEIRKAEDYFDDVETVKVPGEMLKLAEHILDTKKAEFDPAQFTDHYETALVDMLRQKQAGFKPPKGKEQPEAPKNVISLMDALRRSVKAEQAAPPRREGQEARQARRRPEGDAVPDRGQEDEGRRQARGDAQGRRGEEARARQRQAAQGGVRNFRRDRRAACGFSRSVAEAEGWARAVPTRMTDRENLKAVGTLRFAHPTLAAEFPDRNPHGAQAECTAESGVNLGFRSASSVTHAIKSPIARLTVGYGAARLTHPTICANWSGRRESNPRMQLGKLPFYH